MRDTDLNGTHSPEMEVMGHEKQADYIYCLGPILAVTVALD